MSRACFGPPLVRIKRRPCWDESNPTSASKGLEILRWMDARAIAEMVQGEHPQVVAIILSVLENAVAADVLSFLPQEARPEIVERVARLETVQPAACAEELEAIMRKQFASRSSSATSSFWWG